MEANVHTFFSDIYLSINNYEVEIDMFAKTLFFSKSILLFWKLLDFKKQSDHTQLTVRRILLITLRFVLKLTQGWILWTAAMLSHPQARSRMWCSLLGCLAVAHGTSSGHCCGQWWAGERVHPAPLPSEISCLEREVPHRNYSQECFIKARLFPTL